MIRPRQLAHRGSIVATGFAIDAALVGVAEARRRVLALWRPGARVREHDTLLVITGLPPERVRVAAALGAPLLEQHGALAAMPLDVDEAAALSPGAIVLMRGGTADVLSLGTMREIDLSTWIELGELEVCDAKPLAPPPARAAVPPPPPTDVRALTGAPDADDEASEVRAALMGAGSGDSPSLFARFAQWISARIEPRKALPERSGSSPRPQSKLDQLRARLAEALWNSRLGAALGRRHAAYLRRMLELFDRGDLEQALRHAIPIGGEGGERLRVRMPRPRQDLRLSFGSRRTSTVIPLADVAMTMMRDRYRAAAQRLEQSGRIDEAAFVLAELLADPKAAIALLERHERYAVAARLAEARDLEPGLVVRLWFLAGDRERAIDIARRRGAWADAVARLERSGDKRAAVLRMLWADHLANAGDFVRAVEAAWPVQSSRALVESWIDRGIAVDGPAAARLLVKKLIIAPSSFSSVAPALLTILGAPGADAQHQRIAMFEELAASSSTPELQTIARPALRALLRDCGAGAAGTTSELLHKLSGFTDDPALRADRPVIHAAPKPPTLLERASPLDLRWSAHDAGALPVHDCALLPGGRLLLALGELGVRIVGRHGRTIAHIEQPATRLVVSDHGARALAIASRGQVKTIAQLDLIERRGAHWCDTELDSAARTFDGDLWLVTRGSEVFAIDTTAPRWRAVWGVEVDPAHAMCSVRRDGTWFAVAVHDGEELEHWYYEAFTLRARKPWPRIGVELVVARPQSLDTFVVRDPEDATVSDVAQIATIELAGELVVISRHTDDGIELRASHLQAQGTLAHLRLAGASAASIRLTGSLLTIGDDRGRVIVFDLERGTIQRDLRTS